MRRAKAVAVERNGRKPIYRLSTRLGRELEATSNHPVLTSSGWQELGSQTVSEVFIDDCPIGNLPLPDQEVVLLGALIADGALSRRRRALFGTGQRFLPVVEKAVHAYGLRLQRPPEGTSHGNGLISGGPGSAKIPSPTCCGATG